MKCFRVLTIASIFIATGNISAHAGERVSRPAQACFFSSEFEGWRAPDAKTIFIRVRPDRYYRLELSGACPELRFPQAHLITASRGKDRICNALDWDIRVSQTPGGIAVQCVVKSMTQLTKDEVAAIPKQFKP